MATKYSDTELQLMHKMWRQLRGVPATSRRRIVEYLSARTQEEIWNQPLSAEQRAVAYDSAQQQKGPQQEDFGMWPGGTASPHQTAPEQTLNWVDVATHHREATER